MGQPTRITFSYDEAGNQILREICINCNHSKIAADSTKTIETITENDLIKDFNISYYPNPVREELYVKWEKDKDKVMSIEVYSMNGQLMKKKPNLNDDKVTIEFQDYPQGFYNVVLFFDNGEKKALKIIKQ